MANELLTLGAIPAIAANIKTATSKAAELLHKFIFGLNEGRKNRSNLRTFKGFAFNEDSVEYQEKIEFVQTTFTDRDLTLICSTLGLDYEELADGAINKLIEYLTDLNLLREANREQGDEDEEDEKDEDEEEEKDEDEEEEKDGEDKSDDGEDGVINRRFDKSEHSQRENQKRLGQHSIGKGQTNRNPNRLNVEIQEPLERCHLNFKDVEDTIRPFEGKSNYAIENWIADFEDLAELLNWNELQRYIFARKSLKGVAKLYILSEKNITSWKKLKDALLEEFSRRVSNADVHKALMKRKMCHEEDVHEYYLIMKEIASRGSIDDNSLMQYVIEGIQDIPMNKMMLYGAKTLKEFKEKLYHYAAYRADSGNSNRADRMTKIRTPSYLEKNKMRSNVGAVLQKEKSQRCYNCGAQGHKASDCASRALGVKCFKCAQFGHKAPQCKSDRRKFENNATTVSIVTPKQNNMCKKIFIKDVEANALIDTGCDVNIIRADVVQQANLAILSNSDTILNGFGGKKIATNKKVELSIVVDGERYEVDMQVVPFEAMQSEIILGTPFLNSAELIVNKNGVTINKIDKENNVFNIVVDQTKVDLSHISDQNCRKQVETMVENYVPEKVKDVDIEMKILLKDETPISIRPRRLPYAERDIVDSQINQWIDDGIIETCSSEFASPVVVVKKKDGSSRVCIDYRKLNKVAIKDRYPMPVLEDQLDGLTDVKVFSTIDLKNGFFHVKVEDSSKKYTAFITHKGQFQFKRVPFGFCNSPANFQRYINTVFRELQNEGILRIYIDDIIILAKDDQEALERLKLVFKVAREHGLNINLKKSKFLMRRVEFLGHIIEDGKIYPSQEKIKAVMNFPQPKNVKEVQSFLGLTGYFRKFIRDYSVITRPLSDLIKKEKKFQFLKEEIISFEALKEILIKDPVLHIYKRGAETEVHADASKIGLGGILMQKSYEDGKFHPIYYYSKKNSEAEQKYASYELEVLAVLRSLQKFRVYLIGQPFKIISDCAAFKQTVEKAELKPRVARWILALSEFDYQIEHRNGTRMRHVDSLSRYAVMNISEDSITIRIKEAQKTDEYFNAIRNILQQRPYENYYIQNDILYKFEKGFNLIAVPQVVQEEIIKNAHQKGHFGVIRTMENISQEYYIPKLQEKVEKFIRNCIQCILSNRKAGKKEGLLHPRSKGDEPLHTYHIDYMGPLESTSKQYKHILVVIDDFTKFVWIYPTKSTTTKEVINKLELQKKMFGNPCQIISDKGTAFTSEGFRLYCEQEGVEHYTVTTGLPRANGQVERINSVIISVLSKLSAEDPGKWYKYVDIVQRMLNSTFQRSINTTPFEVLIGIKMRNKEDLKVKEALEEEFRKSFCEKRDHQRVEAKKNIQKVKEENRAVYNRRRALPTVYKAGDLVAIKRVQMGPGMKLRPRFLGPYRITKAKNNDTYDVAKVGLHEGPAMTSTCTEYLKPWAGTILESNIRQASRVVGRRRRVECGEHLFVRA